VKVTRALQPGRSTTSELLKIEPGSQVSKLVESTTYSLIGKEAKTLLKMLSSLLAEKWEKPYSVVCGYVNAQMSIAIARATHLLSLRLHNVVPYSISFRLMDPKSPFIPGSDNA
jgi:hypothetical protein